MWTLHPIPCICILSPSLLFREDRVLYLGLLTFVDFLGWFILMVRLGNFPARWPDLEISLDVGGWFVLVAHWNILRVFFVY
jgi:hypothetical protein